MSKTYNSKPDKQPVSCMESIEKFTEAYAKYQSAFLNMQHGLQKLINISNDYNNSLINIMTHTNKMTGHETKTRPLDKKHHHSTNKKYK